MASESCADSLRLEGRRVTERVGFARAGTGADAAVAAGRDGTASGDNPSTSRGSAAGGDTKTADGGADGDTMTADAGAAGSESTETTNEHVVQSGKAEGVLGATRGADRSLAVAPVPAL